MTSSPVTIRVPGRGHVPITAAQIRDATTGQTPKPLQTYAVIIEGRIWPPRQVVHRALGLGTSTNPNSQACMEALHRLGFETVERSAYTPGGKIIVPSVRKLTDS